MLLKLLPHAHRRTGFRFLEARHIGGRRRRRRVQDVIQNPLASNHRRRAGRVGGHGKDTPLAQQAPPPVVVPELDAAEVAAVDIRDAVVLGQALVQERVVLL